MEVECSKCGCRFNATQKDVSVCPDCLKSEFSNSAPKLNEQEYADLVAEYQASLKRQSVRAENMLGMYQSGHAFNVAGKLRLGLGLVIFGICAFVFLISGKDSGVTFLANEDIATQRIFSMIFCVVAAVLIATASVYYKKSVYSLAAFVLVAGWLMPNILMYSIRKAEENEAKIKAEYAEDIVQDTSEKESSGAILSEADLQVFTALKSLPGRLEHYAVFIDNQDSRSRDLLRDALTRLIGAEYTRAYTRANGALYVATNVSGARKNISQILTRFGTVTYAAPSRGVYEVRFDEEKANLVSQYSPDVLTSPMNPSYVTANLSELRCVDSMRVRMSARSLANSNVALLRGEIRNTLVEVLNEPWVTEPDTYSELIEALVVYSGDKDEAAIRHCYNYFEVRRASKREVSPQILRYLIAQIPDQMVRPIVDLWSENPVAWTEMLDMLGFRVQPVLVSMLGQTSDIRLIGSILKYLHEHGTREALPAVKPFLEHSDSILRHSARTTYEAIQNR